MSFLNVVEKVKEEVAGIARAIYNEGLVFETWGNISSRPAENQVVITPSGIHYEKLQYVDMVVVNMSGEIEEGRWKPSTELPLHLAIYRARDDVKAIIHTHSLLAAAFADAGRNSCSYQELAQVVGGASK